ncbi:hypothetical protein BZG35_14235 [Brevundimonas sp. LM2]|uniref:hypothetical protein n=1 Tax=Brevundimonas sp. LM2 TaxID=1938605 RepID=UPI000983CC23|nr:hypothetical protein [Brevundimonas sp. LM2]AQR62676.1 hypothetical protein BZG35_14235 [Brevundimonas sp. LM2]
MIDKDHKNAILAAEREFERRENLARALAVSGITLIGRITSPADPGPPAASPAPSAAPSRSAGPKALLHDIGSED